VIWSVIVRENKLQFAFEEQNSHSQQLQLWVCPNTEAAEDFLLGQICLQVSEFKAFSVTTLLLKDLNTNSTSNNILPFKSIDQVFKN